MNEFHQTLEKLQVAAPELQSDEVCDQIQRYCVLLWHKNQSVNLTRHTDWETFVARDLVDTLELSKCIGADAEVLDIGSGGGVPGLLLAILRPDLEVSLAESVGKRAQILAEFADALSVHVQIYHERAENILSDFRFDATTARAVGPIKKLCTWLDEKWNYVGRLFATKGPNWINERREAEEAGLLKKVEIELLREYVTPGTDRHSVILQLSAKRAPE